MSANNEKNAYSTLGLHKGAGVEEIKRAYVALVKKFDPEKHTDRFMVIQKAFDVLRNPATRAREDVRTLNFILGEFSFNQEERANAPDIKIEQAIHNIERMINAGEVDKQLGSQKLIQGLMIRSWKKVQKKLWAEAIEDWNRILKIDPTHRRAKNNLLYSLITLGYSYATHGLYEEAVEVWLQAAQMDPDNDLLIHNLALACEQAGRTDESQRYWDETVKRWRTRLEREPDNEYLKNCVIEVLREHGDKVNAVPSPQPEPAHAGPAGAHKQAPSPAAQTARTSAKGIEEYREILKLNPNDFEAQFRIVTTLMNEHKWPEAITELEDMRGKWPRNIEVLNLLGWAQLNGGKVDEAFMTWRKAKAIDPKNYQVTESLIKAHMTIGRTLREKGLYTPCLVHFKALMRYLPDSDEVHYEIGKTYQLKGDERSAYQEYQRVLKLNPKHKGARQDLSTLKLRR